MERKKDGSPSNDKFDIHFQALCSAVEQEKLEKVRSILENQTHVNVNGVNGDGFTLLDLAFMTGNQSLLNLVVHHGGKEGAFFPSPESVSAHLLSLIMESRKQVEKFNQLVKMTSGSNQLNTNLSQVQLKEGEKQLTLWQKRLTTMKKLKAGFDSAGCPHAPVEVQASVTGSNNINVKVKEPEKFGNSLFTKFKIQWSHSDTFSEVVGEVEVKTIHTLEYNIEGLIEAKRYFVRASFGNPRGFGPYCASRPKSLVPSSWRNVDNKPPRLSDQADTVLGLLDSLLKTRSPDLSDYSVEDDPDQYEDGKMRKKGLLGLFQSAPKFVKTPRIGVYLNSIMFHEDKVLLTNEDSLPLLEVQDDVPSSATMQADFYWLMKLGYIWPDLSKLRQDMSRGGTDSLRYRLISAACTMQSALGTENLGALFYKPLRHSNGSVVFSLVHHVKSPKALISLSLKWAPLSKAQKHLSVEEEGGVLDMLRGSLREQILSYQVSNISISKGLHLCYLQSHSTIDSMSVVVSNTSPSILPYIKVRENPHVNAEEWSWVKEMGARDSPDLMDQDNTATPTTNFLIGEEEDGLDPPGPSAAQNNLNLGPTEAQYAFGKLIQQTIHRLFQYLEVDDNQREHHRIYTDEIIQLGPDISVILVLPPIETVISVNDTAMAININRRDLLLVPLQSWEVLQLSTYARKLLALHAKLSSILEVDLVLAKKQQREAMSNHESEVATHHLGTLLEYFQTLEDCWRGVRWIRDVLSNSRLKNTRCGVSILSLTDWYSNQPDSPDDAHFAEPANHQIKSANMFKMDTMRNWNARPRDTAASDSGTLQSRTSGGGLSRTPTTRSDPQQFGMMDLDQDPSNLANLAHVRSRLLADGEDLANPQPEYRSNTYSNSTNSTDSNENDYSSQIGAPETNILQVYAAYDTGLAHGTSVRIKVSTSTTAREVVDLVIKQLNMAVILKGKDRPIYENEKLNNFCLVAVIGSRERCLRDDFRPLNLQNPWKKGRLFVRMKHDLLAAIEHLSKHTTVI